MLLSSRRTAGARAPGSGDPVNVVALPAVQLYGMSLTPDFPLVGFARDPDLTAWLQAAPELPSIVTPRQHNAIVAHLAWCKDMLAQPPADVWRPNDSQPFPWSLSLDGELVVGSTPYRAGDITLPRANPAGAAAVVPSAAAQVTIPNAARLQAYQNLQGCLYALSLRPEQLVIMPTGMTTPPAGAITLLGAVVVVYVAGLVAHAAYSAYVQGKIEEMRGQTAAIRVQEEQNTARVIQQLQAQNAALAQRLAFAQRTGTLPEPTPIEQRPVAIQAQQQVTQWTKEGEKESMTQYGLYALATSGFLVGTAGTAFAVDQWFGKQAIEGAVRRRGWL